jgi:hypothetical protein
LYTGDVSNLTLPDRVTNNNKEYTVNSIGKYAFYNCSSLKSIQLPSDINWIGERAFYKCNNLNYNRLEGANYLGNEKNPYLFLNGFYDKNVSTYEYDKVEIIGSHAFGGCEHLSVVSIPKEIK